jgi:hypothetical protein
MDFDAYLANLPLLHTWDNGETWNTGGFSPTQLRKFSAVIREHFGDHPLRVIETGAGNSTITFLFFALDQLVTVAPSDTLRDRILAFCNESGVDTTRLDFRVARSELELPKMVLGSERPGWGAPPDRPRFDVALIDGGHGWPTVFVDFCYLNLMMREGSLLLLDDLQLYSVAELSRLLIQQPGFELRHDFDKLQVWEKTDDEPFLPEHSREPYIIEMTRRADEPRPAPAAAGVAPPAVVRERRTPETTRSRLLRRLSSRKA